MFPQSRLVLSLCAALGLAAVLPAPVVSKATGAPLVPVAGVGDETKPGSIGGGSSVIRAKIHKVAGVGDEVLIRFACKTRESIQAQVDAVLADKNYQRANAMLTAAREVGECAAAPGPVAVIVVQAGPVVTYVDDDGDAMSIQVIGIELGGRTFWSVDLRRVAGA